jgi:CRP-like cAMP-binding protein
MSKNASLKVEPPLHCQFCTNRKNSAFHDLQGDSLNEVSRLKTCVQFKKGQVVMQEGARPQGIYCIHKGKLKLYKLSQDGKEHILRLAANGDLIGYRSILSDEPISASITAIEDTFACYIPKASFFSIIENQPKFSLNLLKLSCHELGEAGKMIASLAQKTVRERLAEVLLVLGSTFGNDEEGYLDIKLTREEISNMVGTAVESAIRLLSDMKNEGLISSKGRRIKIEDKTALREVAAVFD